MNRKTTVDQRKLSEIIRRIVKVAAPEKIILFGSAARGTIGPNATPRPCSKGWQADPQTVREASRLTRFAVVTRYPGFAEPIRRAEYKRVVRIAERVLRWAEKLIAS